MKPVKANVKVEDQITTFGCRIVSENVIARAAYQRVGAAAAPDEIVAGAARILIGVDSSEEHIIERRACYSLDAAKAVAVGFPPRAAATVEIETDAARSACIRHGIEAQSTVEDIGTRAAGQRVVAGLAEEQIIAAAAAQEIGGSVAADDVIERGAKNALNAVERIAKCFATCSFDR